MRVEVGTIAGKTYCKGIEQNKREPVWTLLTELPNGQHRAKLLSGQSVTSQLVIEEATEGRLQS
jgi:hypothetical protein